MTWSDTWFDTHFYSEDRNRHRTDQFCVRYALYYKRLFEDPKFIETLQKRWEMFRGSFMGVPMYIQQKANYLFKSDIVNYPMWPHELNSGDGDLSFDECVNRIQDNYMRKFRFLDDRIRKGDFTQP